jgi:hypothetical protein
MHDRMKQEQSPEVSTSVPLLALDRIWGGSIVAIGGPSSNQAASLEITTDSADSTSIRTDTEGQRQKPTSIQ